MSRVKEATLGIVSSLMANMAAPPLDSFIATITAAATGTKLDDVARCAAYGTLFLGATFVQVCRTHKAGEKEAAQLRRLERALRRLATHENESRQELADLALEQQWVREAIGGLDVEEGGDPGPAVIARWKTETRKTLTELGFDEIGIKGTLAELTILTDGINTELRKLGPKVDENLVISRRILAYHVETDAARRARYKEELRAEIEAEVLAKQAAQTPAQAEALADSIVRAVEAPGFAARATNEGGPLAVLDALEAAAPAKARVSEREVAATVLASKQAAQWAIVIGQSARAAQSLENALRLTQADAWLFILRSRVAATQGSQLKAEAFARMALAAANAASDERQSAIALNEMGNAQLAQGVTESALQSYRDGLAIIKQLAAGQPTNLLLQIDLGVSHGLIASVLTAQGRYSEALGFHQEELTILKRVVALQPTVLEWRSALATCHLTTGDVLFRQENWDRALAEYRECLATMQELANADPANTDWEAGLAVCHSRIGSVHFCRGDTFGAIAAIERTFSIADDLARRDPQNTRWQRNLSISYEGMASVLASRDKVEEALTYQRDSVNISQRLSAIDPMNTLWQHDVALGHAKVAVIAVEIGNTSEARTRIRAGREIMVRLTALDPTNTQWQQDLEKLDAQLQALGLE